MFSTHSLLYSPLSLSSVPLDLALSVLQLLPLPPTISLHFPLFSPPPLSAPLILLSSSLPSAQRAECLNANEPHFQTDATAQLCLAHNSRRVPLRGSDKRWMDGDDEEGEKVSDGNGERGVGILGSNVQTQNRMQSSRAAKLVGVRRNWHSCQRIGVEQANGAFFSIYASECDPVHCECSSFCFWHASLGIKKITSKLPSLILLILSGVLLCSMYAFCVLQSCVCVFPLSFIKSY